jgi:hypothetical protein
MSYSEAIDCEVTRAEAMREIARHGCNAADFIAECGDHQTYAGAAVLAWLGY